MKAELLEETYGFSDCEHVKELNRTAVCNVCYIQTEDRQGKECTVC